MPLQSRPYLPELVNVKHPLVRGLVSWWLCVPGWMGGPKSWEFVMADYSVLTENGVTAVGSSPAGFIYDEVGAGGLEVFGWSYIYYRPRFRVYHKFNVGDIVYVWTPMGHYIQQRVLGLITSGSRVCYKVGIGGAPPEEVVSYDEYHAWLCQQAASLKNDLRAKPNALLRCP